MDALCQEVYERAVGWVEEAGARAAALAGLPLAWTTVEWVALGELRAVVRDWVLDPHLWGAATKSMPLDAADFDDLADIADPARMVIVGHLAPHLADRDGTLERVTARPGRLDADDWAAAFADAMPTWHDADGWDPERFARALTERQGHSEAALAVA